MKNITLTTLLLFITITAFSQTTSTYLSPVASLQKQIGLEEVDIVIEKLKAKNTFPHKEYYSRMKRKYRNMTKTHIDSDDIISEINKKVNDIYLSY